MKRFILILVLFLVACPRPSSPDAGRAEAGDPGPDCNLEAGVVPVLPPTTKVEAHFSPKGGCQDAIVASIRAAKKVRMQAYTLTAQPVIDALLAASAAGGDVEVILDSTQSRLAGNPVMALRNGKIKVFLDAMHALAHNKVLILDDEVVETGSYNFTNASETNNAENCVFITDKAVAASYLANWNAHREHVSVP